MKYTIQFSPFHDEERDIFRNLCQLVNLEWVDLQRQVLTGSTTAALVVEGHRDDITEFRLKADLLNSKVVAIDSASPEPQPVGMDFTVEFKVRAKMADRAEASERLYAVIQHMVLPPNCQLEMVVSELQVWGPK